MKRSYFSKLTGTSFRQDEIAKLSSNAKLRVVRRADNEYDSNAVEVQALLSDGWTQIGWIAKGSNEEIAVWLDDGNDIDIRLSSITGGTLEAPTMGVNVSIEYGEDDSVDISTLEKVKVAYGDDDFIYFNEKEHNAYDKHGKLLLSGSRFEEKYHTEFNPLYPAKAIAKKTGVYTEDVLKMWGIKRDTSASYGTLVHKALEEANNYRELIKQIDDNSEELKSWDRLLPVDLSNIVAKYFKFRKENTPDFESHKIETEVRIKYKNLTGIVDNLETTDDGFYIYDYKVTEDIKVIKFGSLKEKKYTLQQNFYRYILEKVTGKKCLGIKLIVWNGTEWRFENISQIDVEELL